MRKCEGSRRLIMHRRIKRSIAFSVKISFSVRSVD